jgi:hypothetical protein
MTEFQRRKAEAIRHAQSEASSPKSRLIDLVRSLREAGANAKASSLETIIARLETWQNT